MPEAEKANVRLALHPNHLPVPISRGSEQIMATVEHWKQDPNLVKSPFNGMTFDCGVTREMEEIPSPSVATWASATASTMFTSATSSFASLYVDYRANIPDNGQVDLFGVMKVAWYVKI